MRFIANVWAVWTKVIVYLSVSISFSWNSAIETNAAYINVVLCICCYVNVDSRTYYIFYVHIRGNTKLDVHWISNAHYLQMNVQIILFAPPTTWHWNCRRIYVNTHCLTCGSNGRSSELIVSSATLYVALAIPLHRYKILRMSYCEFERWVKVLHWSNLCSKVEGNRIQCTFRISSILIAYSMEIQIQSQWSKLMKRGREKNSFIKWRKQRIHLLFLTHNKKIDLPFFPIDEFRINFQWNSFSFFFA